MGAAIKLTDGQYYGSIDHHLGWNGLLLTDSCYTGNLNLPRHFHSNPYLCFILHGGYFESRYNREEDYRKGDLIFHPRNFEHHNRFDARPTRCFNIEFSDLWITDFDYESVIIKAPPAIRHPAIQTFLHKIYAEFRSGDPHACLMIESLIIELLITMHRKLAKGSYKPVYVKKAVSYIRDNYPANPSLSEIAGYAGVSAEHLSRTFKKAFNLSIGEYTRQVKIEHACNKLTRSKMSLSEIAFELGFADQSHFCRSFKSAVGVSPLTYRLEN